MTRHVCFLLIFLPVAAIHAWAVPDDDPYMRLARISYIEGNVSTQHAADVDWSAASVNLPLEPGDRIYAGYDGRAEIEFEDGSVYRLAGSTDIEVLSLRDDRIQLRVLAGLSTLIVSSDTDFEIDTPVAAFTALRKGTYRFDVRENGDTDAVVRKGELEAANDGFSRRIGAGEMVRIAMREPGQPEFARYERRDAWDEWNDRRNADMNAYAGRGYLPASVTIGVYDLYRHGRWVSVSGYGNAWVPYGVGVSWAPYSVGRWVYRPFYGWTWVSYEPWGWLPYHYGRWYRSSVYGWCWLPGPSFAFNFWSPALVTFYSGPGWISWLPMGPGDYYNIRRYHYHRGIYGHQLAKLRQLHTRGPGDPFHRGVRSAFRTVDVDRFRNGSFGDGGRQAEWRDVDQPWRKGTVVRDRLEIRPTTASFRPAPGRPAKGPERAASAVPAVVRNSPGANLRGQEQYRRISNPDIPSLPSRAERRIAEPKDPVRRTDSGSGVRVLETPRRDTARTPGGNSPADPSSPQAGRRTTGYRWVGSSDNGRANPGRGESPVPENRAGSGNSSTQRNPGADSRRNVPSPPQAETPSPQAKPRTYVYRPNGYVEQRSGNAATPDGRTGRPAEAPQAESDRGYGVPRTGNRPAYSGPRVDNAPYRNTPRAEQAPAYRAPRTESVPSYRSPRMESSPARPAPRQAAPSMERNGGPVVRSAPSPGRSMSSPGTSPAGRTGGGNSSRPSGGGAAQGRNRK